MDTSGTDRNITHQHGENMKLYTPPGRNPNEGNDELLAAYNSESVSRHNPHELDAHARRIAGQLLESDPEHAEREYQAPLRAMAFAKDSAIIYQENINKLVRTVEGVNSIVNSNATLPRSEHPLVQAATSFLNRHRGGETEALRELVGLTNRRIQSGEQLVALGLFHGSKETLYCGRSTMDTAVRTLLQAIAHPDREEEFRENSAAFNPYGGTTRGKYHARAERVCALIQEKISGQIVKQEDTSNSLAVHMARQVAIADKLAIYDYAVTEMNRFNVLDEDLRNAMRVIMRRLIYEDGGRLFAAAEACIRENDPDGATINYEIAMELRQHLLITEYWCHKSPEAVGYYRSSEEVNWASSAQEIPGRKEAVMPCASL